MAQLPEVFRAQDHETMSDFTPIPANKDGYISQIIKSELVPTKAASVAINDGDVTSEVAQARLLKMQEKILEGEYKGRLLFIQLNINNPNQTANEISGKELRSICDACGKVEVTDSEVLHMIPHRIFVKIKPADANWPEKNEIIKYEALKGTAAAAGDVDPFDDEEDIAVVNE